MQMDDQNYYRGQTQLYSSQARRSSYPTSNFYNANPKRREGLVNLVRETGTDLILIVPKF